MSLCPQQQHHEFQLKTGLLSEGLFSCGGLDAVPLDLLLAGLTDCVLCQFFVLGGHPPTVILGAHHAAAQPPGLQ